jgi:hypothetical protein
VAIAAKQTVERDRLWERARAAQLETKLAVAGFAAIAVHVLDDSFFQPQPGTTAGDHLVSGLVPVAILVAAAVVYPRLRAGLRAALAITFGVLGVVIGVIEPAYYASVSGDDYTGLVAAAGGVLLVALGATVAWRARRRDERPLRRYVRRGLLAAGLAIAAFFVLVPLGLAYAFTHAARTKTPHGDLGAPYQAVAFYASDGLRLKGWFVPAKNGATVIVFPGKRGTQRHARCSSATGTACSSSTAGPRGRAKVIRTRSAGLSTAT